MLRAWTPEEENFAYAYGALLGDGSIKCYPQHRTYRILFTVKDRDFAEAVKKSMDICFKESERTKLVYNKKTNYHTIRLAHKKICEWVLAYNMENILEYDEKIKTSFMRGLYDAEGHVNISEKYGIKCLNHIDLTNTNQKMLEIASKILKELEIKHSICNKWKKQNANFKKCYVIYICGKQNFIKFREKIGFNIKRKNELLQYLPRDRNDELWHKRLSNSANKRQRDSFGKFIAG